MKPILFKGFHTILNAPPDWNEKEYGPCEGLPIMRAHDCLYSCWKPSLWERVKLIFGQPITLIVASRVHPPVSLNVKYPLGKRLKP